MLSKTSVIKNGGTEEAWVIKQPVGGTEGGGDQRVCVLFSALP